MLQGSSNLPAGSGCRLRLAMQTALFACGAAGRYAASPEEGRLAFLPIWSCSVWGLPCRSHRCERGGLLPHPFTLTASLLQTIRRFAFCCTGRLGALTRRSRTLSGTLPCGVRTFLPRQTLAEARKGGSDHPAACTSPVYATTPGIPEPEHTATPGAPSSRQLYHR